MTVRTLDGPVRVPEDLQGDHSVILLFRGSWCPYCVSQLRAFQRAHERLRQDRIAVVAMSVDDRATTEDLVREHGLMFPVGYGVDALEVAAATGAFLNEHPRYLQSTGFVLDPDARVVISVYSSGAIGRLVPEDVLGLVRYRLQAAGQ
jgi:peroxiredoxin